MYRCSWIALCIIALALTGCEKAGMPIGNLEPGIALTFDDAYLTEWVDMLPVLNKYDAHATFFVCPYNGFNQENLDKLFRLYDEGNEIGFHTMNHPDLEVYLREHSWNDYLNNEILPGIAYFDSLGIPLSSFAYPYGIYTRASNKELSVYFSKIRGVGSLQYGSDQSYILQKNVVFIFGTFMDRPSHNSLQDFKQAMLAAKSHHSVLVIIGHRPVQEATTGWTFPISLLDSICHFAQQQNMQFYRLRDL